MESPCPSSLHSSTPGWVLGPPGPEATALDQQQQNIDIGLHQAISCPECKAMSQTMEAIPPSYFVQLRCLALLESSRMELALRRNGIVPSFDRIPNRVEPLCWRIDFHRGLVSQAQDLMRWLIPISLPLEGKRSFYSLCMRLGRGILEMNTARPSTRR